MSNSQRLDPDSTPTTIVSLSPLPPPPPQVDVDHPIMERLPTMASAPSSGTIASLPPPPPPPRRSTPDPRVVDRTPGPPSRVDMTTFVSPAHSFLAKRQTHLSLLLLATEQAQQMAWKNQLQLGDLLQGLVQDLSSASQPLAPFRSIGRSLTMQWNSMPINIIDHMTQMSPNTAQELLQQHAQLQPTDGNLMEELDLLEDQVDALLFDPTSDESRSDMQRSIDRQSQLEQITKDAFALTSPPNIPWLCRFRAALDESTNWLEHDLIGAPAVCIVVVSSSEDNIIEAAKALCYSPHYLPDAYSTGVLDAATLRREVVVLHDAVSGPTDFREDDILAELKRSFGSGSAVLRINSILPTMAKKLEEENKTDLWGGNGKRGNCLSHSDRLSLRRYLAHIITSSLLPALERRIFDLNNIVTERKKGVRNVFKSLWRGGPTKELTMTNSINNKNLIISKYRHDTVESQVRLLADTLFLVKDYDSALNMYKLIKDDYKHDRSLMHHAGIQEMMALCLYLLNDLGNSKEIFGCFETALFSYTRAAEEERKNTSGPATRPTTAPAATRLATRLCLVMSAAKAMSVERHFEVADLLASASSNETSLGAAVLLEQAAAHYFKAGMYRKFAFHTLMSGHMFRSGSQEHHAFRCFTAALYIYHDGQWDELHNHLRSALAAQLFALGRMAASVELYAKLVGTTGGGRVSVKSQQKFVNHLLEICKGHTETALIGADRMAAPGSSDIRKNRFERIENVLRYTQDATRVLELPNMDLPYVDDSSVTTDVAVEANRVGEIIPTFGTIGIGSDAVWQELQCHTVAELKAVIKNNEDEASSSALAKIEDADIRRVVSEIDKEKTNQNLMARAKRSGTYKETPPVRARMEPLAVHFDVTNPLAVLIELKNLQLVAQLKEKATHRVCTNLDAIDVGQSADEPRTWSFKSTSDTFFAPAFCRMSPEGGENVKGAWKSVKYEDPYFVVTKVDLSLQPGSKTRVHLSICPLVQGDLEILGLRCKLFNDVWVFHPFKIKGALLRNSAENKSSRLRAESMLLKAKVEQDMPRLVVNLTSSHQSSNKSLSNTLQGQISHWTLQISNRGTAPATNIVLKTNLPWINISTSRSSEEEETSSCVGPSGTLLALATLNNSIIQPNKTLDIPIILRTTGTASQDFYMLYRYEHADDSKKHRWLQQMITVPVYASLQVIASLMPSYWAKDEHVLSVEVTNLSHESIILDRVCLASRDYRLGSFEGQVDTSTDLTLQFQERLSMHYRLITESSDSSTCFLSECSAVGETFTKSQACLDTGTVDYLCLEGASSRFRAALRGYEIEVMSAGDDDEQQPRHVSQIRRAKMSSSDENDEAPSHPTSISKLCRFRDRKSKIHLICCWKAAVTKATDTLVHGQHLVPDLLVRPKTKSQGCPITITCRHPTSVVHNFTNGPIHIQFEVTVRNRLVEASVEFEFALERQKTFEFMGGECFEWEMEGGEELTVPLQAVISIPGVYNLQAVRLTVTKEGKKVPYLFPLQWLISVGDVI